MGKNSDCIRINPNACVVQGDGYGEQDWMSEYKDDVPEDDVPEKDDFPDHHDAAEN